MLTRSRIPMTAVAAIALAACGDMPRLPQAPQDLLPPPGEVLVMKAFAAGVQVYQCAAAQDGSAYQWRFKGPEAALMNGNGRTIGKHYGGPTWEALDGSKVVGEVRAQAKAPDPDAIPLLLLEARANSGDGTFAAIRSIQRLETSGGRAPALTCSAGNTAEVARVPYLATYYFYADAR